MGFLSAPDSLNAIQECWSRGGRGGANWNMTVVIRKQVGWLSCGEDFACNEFSESPSQAMLTNEVYLRPEVWASLLNDHLAGGWPATIRNQYYSGIQAAVFDPVCGGAPAGACIGFTFKQVAGPPIPTPVVRGATPTVEPAPAGGSVIIRIEGLDEWGIGCSTLVFFKGESQVDRVPLRGAPGGVVQYPTDKADWFRFEGSPDGQCPWTRWTLADGSPDRIGMDRQEISLRFVPVGAVIRIEGLDEWGLKCSRLVFYKGDQEVRGVALRDHLDGRVSFTPGEADWFRFVGDDQNCPWSRFFADGFDPDRVGLGQNSITLRFVEQTPTPGPPVASATPTPRPPVAPATPTPRPTVVPYPYP